MKNKWWVEGTAACIEVCRYSSGGGASRNKVVSRHVARIDAIDLPRALEYPDEWRAKVAGGKSYDLVIMGYGGRSRVYLYAWIYGDKAGWSCAPSDPFDLRRASIPHFVAAPPREPAKRAKLTPDTWAEVYRDYRNLVASIADKFTQDPEAIADIVQETFFRAFRNYASFDGQYTSAWLGRIANNYCIDIYRRTRNHPAVSWEYLTSETFMGDYIDTNDILDTADEDEVTTPAPWLERHERERGLQGVFWSVWPKLLPDHREVMRLHYLEGLSCEEIGEMQGIGRTGIKSKLFRARAAFKEACAEIYGPGSPLRELARPDGSRGPLRDSEVPQEAA